MSGYSTLLKSTPQTSNYFGHLCVHYWFLKGDPQKKILSLEKMWWLGEGKFQGIIEMTWCKDNTLLKYLIC